MNSTYQTVTLASGLRIILSPEASPVAYLGIAVRAGARDESRRYYGLSHSIEHMLFKGTHRRSSLQIIDRLESVGAELNAYTTKEETILYSVLPKQYVRRSLSMLLDLVSGSRFPESEWTKEQEVIIDEIHSYEDSPSELIFDELEDQVFRGHPLGHAILGTESSVGRIGVRQQRDFFLRHYRPEEMVLFAQGDIPMELLVEYAEARFTGGANPRLSINLDQPLPEEKLTLMPEVGRRVIRRKQTSQSHVVLARRAYPMGHPHRLALSFLSNMLGGNGMNALLNMQLREHRGLVYHVESNYTTYTDAGLFSIYFGSSHRAEEEARRLVYDTLGELAERPLSPERLASFRRQLRGQLIVLTDNREQHFLSMGKTYLHTGRYESDESLLERLERLTPEYIHQVAREVFVPSAFHELIYR